MPLVHRRRGFNQISMVRCASRLAEAASNPWRAVSSNGTERRAVAAEAEPVMIVQPGDLVLRRMKGPETQGQNNAEDHKTYQV